MNEEQRKKVMETATWEELTQKGLTNNVEFGYYYEALVLRSIRGLKQAAILEVLNTIYKKVQHQQDKNEFAKNVFLFYEQNPNGYKLSDTHRQIISEWAETESEQPQQENEFPERVRKGLNDNVLLEMFGNNKETLIEFLLFCEQAKNGESIIKEANRLKLFDNNTIKKVHDKIFDLFGNKVTGYDNWKTYAVRKR